jgi:hypothetical protein
LAPYKQVPRGFVHETILVAGFGVTGTVDRYGTVMRTAFNTSKTADVATSHTGYWTDNVSWKLMHGGCERARAARLRPRIHQFVIFDVADVEKMILFGLSGITGRVLLRRRLPPRRIDRSRFQPQLLHQDEAHGCEESPRRRQNSDQLPSAR